MRLYAGSSEQFVMDTIQINPGVPSDERRDARGLWIVVTYGRGRDVAPRPGVKRVLPVQRIHIRFCRIAGGLVYVDGTGGRFRGNLNTVDFQPRPVGDGRGRHNDQDDQSAQP